MHLTFLKQSLAFNSPVPFLYDRWLLPFTLKVSTSMIWSNFPRDRLWPCSYTCVHRDIRADTCAHSKMNITLQMTDRYSHKSSTSRLFCSSIAPSSQEVSVPAGGTLTSLSILYEIERADWEKGRAQFCMQPNEPWSGEMGSAPDVLDVSVNVLFDLWRFTYVLFTLCESPCPNLTWPLLRIEKK